MNFPRTFEVIVGGFGPQELQQLRRQRHRKFKGYMVSGPLTRVCPPAWMSFVLLADYPSDFIMAESFARQLAMAKQAQDEDKQARDRAANARDRAANARDEAKSGWKAAGKPEMGFAATVYGMTQEAATSAQKTLESAQKAATSAQKAATSALRTPEKVQEQASVGA